MSHDVPKPIDSERTPASIEELRQLRDRIDAFVQAFGPNPIPTDALIVDTGKEAPRPLVEEDEEPPTVFLSFPGDLLSTLTPNETRRLEIAEFSVFRNTPYYLYFDEIPEKPEDVDFEELNDQFWSLGGSGVYIKKTPDAEFDVTVYRVLANGESSQESESHPGQPFPKPDRDPSSISKQDCEDIETIVDALAGIDPNELSEYMTVELS